MSQDYYTRGGMEAFDVIEAFRFNFNLGNVFKYISRCGYKGDPLDAVTDLVKAQEYLEREIASRRATIYAEAKDDLRGLAEYEAKRWD